MLNINPREMHCAFPAAVVECQCPCNTASSLERLGVCSQDTPLLILPSSYSSISFSFLRKRKERRRGKKRKTSIFFTLADRHHEQKRQFDLLMWEIRFPSEIYPVRSRIQVKYRPKKKKKKKKEKKKTEGKGEKAWEMLPREKKKTVLK